MNQRNILFTTNYAVYYDSWVKVPSEGRPKGFFDTYTRKDYTINVTSGEFYLLLEIIDSKNKVVFKGTVRTIPDYIKLKRKLKWI
jgi:hypothetical protein